jgi:Ca2+-binding EF-hand superfamily protein
MTCKIAESKPSTEILKAFRLSDSGNEGKFDVKDLLTILNKINVRIIGKNPAPHSGRLLAHSGKML